MSGENSQPRPKRTRFVPLDPEFASDDRLVDVSRDAEWLFLRCIALSSRLLSDGRLTIGQVRRECADKAEEGEVTMMLCELEEAGLFQETSPGTGEWVLSGFKKNNQTAKEVADAQLRKRLGGDFGRHKQYHQESVEGCLFCENPDKSFASVLAIAGLGSGLANGLVTAKPLHPKPLLDSESESESESKVCVLLPQGDPRETASTLKETHTQESATSVTALDWQPTPSELDTLTRSHPKLQLNRSLTRFKNHHQHTPPAPPQHWHSRFCNWCEQDAISQAVDSPKPQVTSHKPLVGYHRPAPLPEPLETRPALSDTHPLAEARRRLGRNR